MSMRAHLSIRKEERARALAYGSVRPGVVGLLTGVEYSRVGISTWICPTSIITTRTAVGLVDVQENQPTSSD